VWLGGKFYLVHLGELMADWKKMRLAFVSTEDQLGKLSQHLFAESRRRAGEQDMKHPIDLAPFATSVIPPGSSLNLRLSSFEVISQLIDRYVASVKAGERRPRPEVELWFDLPS